MKKLVFIGGGVSTTYSVLYLLKNGYEPKKISIIEKGRDLDKRGSDEVMVGIGGSGGISDYKIIISFTQGGEFTPHYVPLSNAQQLSKEFISYIKEFHPDPLKIEYTDVKEVPKWLKNSRFELKQSPCMHIGTDYGKELTKNIFNYFEEKGVKILTETEVVDINFENKSIIIAKEFQSAFYDEDPKPIYHVPTKFNEIFYDKLIIAGGKAGTKFLNDIINKNNIPTEPRSVSIGVRYETDMSYFKELLKIAYDFKLYKQINENVSIRTFCVNTNSSYITPEKTFDLITFNGHSYKDPSKYSGLVNFGVMLDIRNEIEDPFQFMKDLTGKYNLGGKGSHYSPINRPTSKTGSGKEIPSNPIILNQFKAGYGKYANYILEFIEELNNLFNINNDYIIYVPEVKYTSNKLVFNNKDFSLIDHPDVHIIGDNAVSRGIYIAALSGMYVSSSFLKAV